MKSKLLKILTALLLISLSLFTFTACGNDNDSDNKNQDILSIYNMYVVSAQESGVEPLSYEDWLSSIKGEKTSTNPMATIYAWTGALKKRGELDNLPKLVDFANKLEKACIDTLLSGVMTKDLVNLTDGSVEIKQVNTSEFIKEIRNNLEKSL